MPFLQFGDQPDAPGADLSAIGESSKIVPTLSGELRARVLVVALPPALVGQIARVRLAAGRAVTTPSGQRMADHEASGSWQGPRRTRRPDGESPARWSVAMSQSSQGFLLVKYIITVFSYARFVFAFDSWPAFGLSERPVPRALALRQSVSPERR